MTMPTSFTGINRRQLIEYWRLMGGTVEAIRRTGEIRLTHPRLHQPITMNNRRKDGSRRATAALNAIRNARPER